MKARGALAATCAAVVLRAYLHESGGGGSDFPQHMLGHSVAFEEDILHAETAASLRQLMKDFGSFPTNGKDLQFYNTTNEHVGEARPIEDDGSCTHPFLVPSLDGTLCVLPPRLDIARHFILTGGMQGLREPYDRLASRVQSFGRYMFNLSEYPQVAALFDDDAFVRLARRICPAEKSFLDPFQFNLIVQLPGQTVAAHVDSVNFWGATRFQVPQWLLAAMDFSGLFISRFVDQVQVVAYFHEWNVSSRAPHGAGNFLYFDRVDERTGSLAATSESPVPRAGSAVDGTKTVHAADLYAGSSSSPDLPFVDKDNPPTLMYDAVTDGWDLTHPNGSVLQAYAHDDLRTTIVYRARCFSSAEEADRFAGVGGPQDETLSVEEILRTLSKELVRRGAVGSVDEAMRMDRLQLAVLIVDTFVRYPLPPRWIQYNYCALGRIWPATRPLLSFVC